MYKSSLCRFLIDKFAGKNLFAALESAQLRILDAKHDAYLGSDLLFILMAAPPSVSLSVHLSGSSSVRDAESYPKHHHLFMLATAATP